MQIKRIFIVSLLLLLVVSTSRAVDNEIITSFSYYKDNSGLLVLSPGVSIKKSLSDKVYLKVKVRIDAVSSATIQPADAVTGATPAGEKTLNETRRAFTLSGIYDDGINYLDVSGYHSEEKDYLGRSIFLNYSRQLNEQNTALGIGLALSNDKWQPIIEREFSRKDRKERKLDLSISQILTKGSTVHLLYSAIYSEGLLSSPYHYIEINSIKYYEVLPTDRFGQAFGIRYVRLIDNLTSLNLYYRYYFDDCQIKSNTFNIELYRDLSSTLTGGLRYRYYIQDGASFAKNLSSYTGRETFRVVQYKYTDFSSNTFGMMLSYRPARSPAEVSNLKLKFSADYYVTSSNDNIRYWFGKDRLRGLFFTLSFVYNFD